MSCNCSVCWRNGYIYKFIAAKDMDWSVGGLDKMTEYTFNKKHFKHYFCPTCGTSVCVKKEEDIGLNVRVLDVEMDVSKLEFGFVDGKRV